MKKLLTLFTLLLLVCSGAWGDTVLFTTNFSTADGWDENTSLASGSKEINGTTVSFKDGGSVAAGPTSGTLTFGGTSNLTNTTSVADLDHYIAIPVTGVVGGTVTITTVGGSTNFYYCYSDGSTSTCSSREQGSTKDLITITGLTKSNVTIYIGSKSKSMTKLTVTTPELIDLSSSSFYSLYKESSSTVTADAIISDASLPSYISIKNCTSADNGSSNTSSVTSPHDFSAISSNKYYRLKPGSSSSIVIGALSHVKSIRVYGNGSGSTGNVVTAVSKISGTGTAMTIENKAFANSKTTIVEYSTGDITKLTGYDADTYYQYTITFSASFSLWGVYVEYAEPATPKTSTTTTISGGSGLNKDIKNGTSAGTLSASVTVTSGGATIDGATVTWSSTDTSIAEVNETTGAITLVAPGDVQITATYDGDETYASSFDTYELNVEDSRAEITPSLTYDNTTLILGQTTTATPTLTGNTGNGDVTYSSDNTSVATVDADGVVTAVAVGTAHITANIAATSDYRAGSAQATITVANNPLGSHTVTYTLDVTSEEDKNKTDINSSNVSTSLSLNTLIGITNNTGGSYTKGSKANLTVKIPTPADYDENNYMSVGFTVADGYVFVPTTVSVKAQPVTTNKDVKLVLTNGKKSIDKTQTCTAGSITTLTMTNDEEVSLTGDVTLKIYCYGATDTYRLGSPITISGDVVKVETATIPSSGWGTYCSSYALDFSDQSTEVEAYAVSAYDVENLTITYAKQTGVVPAGTGILLKGTAGAANIVVSNEAGSAPAVNKLVGFVSPTEYTKTGDTRYLGLSGGNWKEMNAGMIPANKAVLEITSAELTTLQSKLAGGDAKFTIILDDEPSGETDGIRSMENGELRMENYDYYNLAGQRVGKDYKGIVIVNGKKYVRK